MPGRRQGPEECDATGFHSSNAVRLIKICRLNSVPINKCIIKARACTGKY